MKIKSWVRPTAATGLLVLLTACSSTNPTTTAPSASSTVGAAPTPAVITPGAPPPPGATGAPVVGVSTLPPVPAGQAAQFSDARVEATVVKVDPIQIAAQGPGELSGPGVGVTVQIGNNSPKPIDLGDIAINASYAGGTPASSADSAPAKPLAGQLAPGAKQSGVYVFSVPTADAKSLVVEVNYSGSANVVLVRR